MTTGTHPFRFAALASVALILPFAILQLRNGSVSRGGVAGVAALENQELIGVYQQTSSDRELDRDRGDLPHLRVKN